MTVELFDLESSPNPAVSQTGGTLQSFRMVGIGAEDKRKVSLEFVAYLPYSESLYRACSTYHHKMVYLKAAYSQSELVFNEADELEDAEPDGDDEPEDSDNPGSEF